MKKEEISQRERVGKSERESKEKSGRRQKMDVHRGREKGSVE